MGGATVDAPVMSALAQSRSEKPIFYLWERSAAQRLGEGSPAAGGTHGVKPVVSAPRRAKPLTLALSHKGRGKRVRGSGAVRRDA